MSNHTTSPHFVYLISSPNAVKIGISVDPEKRLAALQTSNPDPLVLRYVLECEGQTSARFVERSLHERYAEYCSNGEWFNVPVETIISDIAFGLNLSMRVNGVKNINYEEVVIPLPIHQVEPYHGIMWIRRLIKSFKAQTIIRTSNAEDAVIAYLIDNPKDMGLSVRELAKKLNISKSVVGRAKQKIGE